MNIFCGVQQDDLVPYVFNKILIYTYQGPKGRHCQIHDFYNLIANAMQMTLFFWKMQMENFH